MQKFCSPACYAASSAQREASQRGGASQRGKRKGAANPAYKHGRRVGENDREGQRRWSVALGTACCHPQCPGDCTGLQLHHVVYRQAVERAGGDVWDPRNALTLGMRCHGRHHKRAAVLSLTALRDENFAFACDLLGAGAAYEYLRRRYAGDDPRLDALLLEEAA